MPGLAFVPSSIPCLSQDEEMLEGGCTTYDDIIHGDAETIP